MLASIYVFLISMGLFPQLSPKEILFLSQWKRYHTYQIYCSVFIVVCVTCVYAIVHVYQILKPYLRCVLCLWDFGTYQWLAKASINCPCWRSGASCLNSGLHLYLVYSGSKGSGDSTYLHRLTWTFILETVMSTKIICAGSFDLFFASLVTIYLAWFELCKSLEGCNFVTMIIFPFGMLNRNKIKFHC